VEGWGEGKFAEEVGVRGHPISIQDGSIENLLYRAFRSKITLALQASCLFAFSADLKRF
jgi:hypothetical protein